MQHFRKPTILSIYLGIVSVTISLPICKTMYKHIATRGHIDVHNDTDISQQGGDTEDKETSLVLSPFAMMMMKGCANIYKNICLQWIWITINKSLAWWDMLKWQIIYDKYTDAL